MKDGGRYHLGKISNGHVSATSHDLLFAIAQFSCSINFITVAGSSSVEYLNELYQGCWYKLTTNRRAVPSNSVALSQLRWTSIAN